MFSKRLLSQGRSKATSWRKELKNNAAVLFFSHNILHVYFPILLLFLLLVSLTHYQTRNVRLFQTERVCREQFQI